MTPVDWAALVGGGGALGIIGVLIRISYQMGGFVTEFRTYVRVTDALIDKHDQRIIALERRRR